MSDTPRTDQMEKLVYWIQDDMTPVCDSRFARQLEMELIAAQQRIKRLEDYVETLEECGDSLFNSLTRDEALERWKRAKEAKP